MASFKVLTECSVIVQSIFQVYEPSASLDIKFFFPFTKSTLILQASLVGLYSDFLRRKRLCGSKRYYQRFYSGQTLMGISAI